jgi:hypothetical protein
MRLEAINRNKKILEEFLGSKETDLVSLTSL